MSDQVRTTIIIISGSAPWVPVGIASATYPAAASARVVLNDTLVRVSMGDAVLCAVRSLPSMAHAAEFH
jgi:hypothetical protein